MSDLASRLAALRRQAGGSASQESPLKRLPQGAPPSAGGAHAGGQHVAGQHVGGATEARQQVGGAPSARQHVEGASLAKPQVGGASLAKPQVGGVPVGAASAAIDTRENPPRTPDLAMLRRMAGVRDRLGQPREPLRSYTRDDPGYEIAPGLRYLEQRFAWAEP